MTASRGSSPNGTADEGDAALTKEHMQKATAVTDEERGAVVEDLGKQRPEVFRGLAHEMAFIFSMLMSQFLMEFFTTGFPVLIPSIIREFNLTTASAVWPTTVYSLIVSATLLIYSKLCDMWGGYMMYLFGLTWLLIWSIIGGFSTNPLMLIFCRALQGLGAGVFSPAGVMLMGSVYRPGPRKNFVFSLLGAFAVLGFFAGIFFAGIVAQFSRWSWFFWIGAILDALAIVTTFFYVPNDRKQRQNNEIKFDWIGAITSFSGIILVVFAITESAISPQGWRTPYIPVLFCVGIVLLAVMIYVEGWVAEHPLIPLDVFADTTMIILIVSLFLIYGDLSILLLYGTQYFIYIMEATPMLVVAWYVPLAVGGLAINILEGSIMHLVSGHVLLVCAGLGAVGSQLLLAFLPSNANYWAWIFPAMILGTISIDMSYNIMTVYVTTHFTHERQGLAGGVMGVLLQLGVALALGFASILQVETSNGAEPMSEENYEQTQADLARSYKNVFWLGVGMGGVALFLLTFFGKISKAQSDLTENEKEKLSDETSAKSDV